MRGHDVLGIADDPELDGLTDEAVLELATADRRIVITRNSRDFAPLCRTWAEAGREHAGVILVWTLSHDRFAEIAAGVENWLAAIPEAEAWRGITVAL